jgi:hypothetical protein
VDALTPSQRADQIRRAFDAGHVTRSEAIAELCALFNLTEAGAGNLLDDPRLPSARWAETGGES